MSVPSYDLLYPMLAMFLWTFLVALRNLQVRVSALLKGELTNKYFELFQGPQPSETILKTGNHLRNLMEMPPLFYIACLAVMVIGRADGLFSLLAWSYVALRVAHSLVHLTINKVPPRFFFFALSNTALLLLWLRLAFIR